jgi:hypothetical protein
MSRHPTILIPYVGPSVEENVQDVVLYLRPETNGVLAESCMLGAVHANPAYRSSYKLAYLANIPGDFMTENHIVEEHYALKIRFAREGAGAFTRAMRKIFETRFGVSFEKAEVVGAFEALSRLDMNEEQLFRTWVDGKDFARIHQQTVKKIDGLFVVNYDIPALLHRNTRTADIFAMILRSFAPYEAIHELIGEMCDALAEAGIVSERTPPSRVFHYSKGPFEQILDGIGYVYTTEDRHIPYHDLSFYAFLKAHDIGDERIMAAVHDPIMTFHTPEGSFENNLFDYTIECSFPEALAKLRQAD